MTACVSKAAVASLLAVALVFCGAGLGVAPGIGALRAWAYFDRGPVGIDLGAGDVVLDAGQSASFTCIISPEYDDQLPGCGMATCPDECPEGCLDGNGQCTCGGTEYARWYTTVSVMSSDPSVARADWAGGALTVSGYEPGEAVITVTARLKQFEDSELSLHVTVNAIPEEPDGGEDEYVSDATVDGQGDASTNVVNGTGDADNAYLGAGAQGEGASYDKPAAAAPEGADAPEVPDVPEVPVEPDASQPVVLYELEQVEAADAQAKNAPDPLYAGATGVAACAFMVVGMAGTGSAWRRERG